jgi:hypothetical protein
MDRVSIARFVPKSISIAVIASYLPEKRAADFNPTAAPPKRVINPSRLMIWILRN